MYAVDVGWLVKAGARVNRALINELQVYALAARPSASLHVSEFKNSLDFFFVSFLFAVSLSLSKTKQKERKSHHNNIFT